MGVPPRLVMSAEVKSSFLPLFFQAFSAAHASRLPPFVPAILTSPIAEQHAPRASIYRYLRCDYIFTALMPTYSRPSPARRGWRRQRDG